VTRPRATWLALLLAARGAHAEGAPVAAPPVVSTTEHGGDAPSARQIARERFAAGVSLASAGRYSEARAEFLKAHAALPHFIVLYNIGLVDIQLGNFASAAQFLRQYLAEGAGAILAEQRELVTREVERLDAISEAAPEATAAGVARATTELRAGSTQPPVSNDVSTAIDGRTPNVSRRVLAPSRTPGDIDARTTLAGYVLVGGGFVALAGAAVAHIWNHDRYLDWKHRHEELTSLRETAPLVVEDEAALRARISDTNARLRSVQRFDPVPVILAGLGVLASGVGVWTLIKTNDDAHWRLASQTSELMLETSWTW
jgi:hypothetical protein